MADANSIEGQRLDGTVYRDCSMADLRFENVNLKGARFQDVNLSGSVLDDVNFSNVSITNSCIDGLVIWGYDIHALLQPLLEHDAEARKPD
jgi:uncharacterized protein YjbI with pentapeptide repeats